MISNPGDAHCERQSRQRIIPYRSTQKYDRNVTMQLCVPYLVDNYVYHTWHWYQITNQTWINPRKINAFKTNLFVHYWLKYFLVHSCTLRKFNQCFLEKLFTPGQFALLPVQFLKLIWVCSKYVCHTCSVQFCVSFASVLLKGFKSERVYPWNILSIITLLVILSVDARRFVYLTWLG